jgi:5-methyltetrahydrofolate--homocysteine methyltransferase
MPIREIFNSVLAMDCANTVRWVEAELDQGTDATVILNEGLIAAMDEVGRRYARGIFFVPEMLMAAQAMQRGMSVVRPCLENADAAPSGCVVIGTVKGDQHDIGKNLVAMMLECAGFEVVDLGKDVEAGAFVKAARHNGADIVALSALLTTTLASMEAAVSRIKSEAKAPKTLVGGAPVTQAFADRIGADGFSPDAIGAVAVARRLMGNPGGRARSGPPPSRQENHEQP